MTIVIIAIHVVACLVLIFVVLLQAGRGGGLSEMIGASQPSSIFGTQTNAFMTRATEICAVVFILTSVTLGIMSAKGNRSLVEGRRAPMQAPAAGKIPALPASEAAKAPQAPAAAADAQPALPAENDSKSAPVASK